MSSIDAAAGSAASLMGSDAAALGIGIRLKAAAKMDMAAIDHAAKDFEAMFISQMMEPMFGDSVGEEAFGDKETSEIYKNLVADAYGRQVATAGGIGIASFVKQELLKLQEVAP